MTDTNTDRQFARIGSETLNRCRDLVDNDEWASHAVARITANVTPTAHERAIWRRQESDSQKSLR